MRSSGLEMSSSVLIQKLMGIQLSALPACRFTLLETTADITVVPQLIFSTVLRRLSAALAPYLLPIEFQLAVWQSYHLAHISEKLRSMPNWKLSPKAATCRGPTTLRGVDRGRTVAEKLAEAEHLNDPACDLTAARGMC